MLNLNTTTEKQMNLLEMIKVKEKEVRKYEMVLNRPNHFKDILFKIAEIPMFSASEDLEKHFQEYDVNGSPLLKFDEDEQIPGYKSLWNKTNMKLVSVVSNQYHVVDNDVVLQHFEEMLLSQNIKFEYGFAVTARNGRKTVMELILPEMIINLGNGDTQEMRLYIQNSFDGGNSIKLDMGFFRHICSNMALMHGKAEVQYKTSHIGNATSRIKTQFNFYITEKFNESQNFIKKLNENSFNSIVDIYNFINSEENTIVSNRDREKVKTAYEAYYQYDFANKFWGVYNAYTHVITHNLTGSDIGKMKKLTELSMSFEKLIKNNNKMKKEESYMII